MRAEARVAGLLALLSVGVLVLAYQLEGDLLLDFGPNDRLYVSGFREDFEIDEPTLIHWSRDRARVRLPFYMSGDYEVTLRFKRHIEKPADVRIFLGGEPVESFEAPQQDFQLRTFHRAGAVREPFELALVSASEDPRPLGLALDWMQVRPARAPGAALPSPSALLALLSWVAAFYLLARLVGLERRIAFLLGASVLAAIAGAAVAHKLWPVHVALTLGARPHVFLLALAAFYLSRRRDPRSFFSRPEARWAIVLVCAGLAIRLFATFHPDFYYPDVRTHSKFVSLIWTEGLESFLSNHIENQHRHLLGLQYVADRWVAFPYPPLLYLTIYPLSLLELPVDDWMKLVPAALLAVEALVVFVLAQKLGAGARTALLAVALHASARVLAFRLAVASFAALYGHFWDLLAVLYLTFFFERLPRPRFGVGLGLLVAISLLSYAGSALVLGLFVPILCLVLLASSPRPPTARILAVAGWSLAGAVAAVALFYGRYVPELIGSRSGAAGADAPGLGGLVDLRLTPFAALEMAGYRLVLFYGVVFGGLAVAALGWLWWKGKERLHPLALPLALAAAGTYVGMNFLRAGLGATHIFQFSKDDLVILPLVSILLGAMLNGLARKGPALRALAALLLAGWIGFGVVSLAGDVRGRFLLPDYPPPEGGSQEAKTTRFPPARLAW